MTDPMTSPTQRAGADVQRYFPVPRNATMLKLDGEVSGGYVAADDHEKAVAALQARIAELEARNAASERDAERWRWIRENANPGFTQIGKPWGLLCASLEVRAWPQIEAAIDAHAQGQAGEE